MNFFFICFRFDKEIINTYYTDVGRLRTSVEKHKELYAEIQKQQEVNDIYKKDCIPNNRQSHLRRFFQMYTNELSVIFYHQTLIFLPVELQLVQTDYMFADSVHIWYISVIMLYRAVQKSRHMYLDHTDSCQL